MFGHGTTRRFGALGAIPRASLLVILLAAASRADTITLRNGRTIEGQVVSQGRSVRIRVEGGTIELPRDQIASIEEGATREDEYSRRYLETSLDDPESVDRLADWARAQGLEGRARELASLALGVRLEQGFSRARAARDPAAFARLAEWARTHGLSPSVQRLALENAVRLAPDDEASRLALRKLDEQGQEATRVGARRRGGLSLIGSRGGDEPASGSRTVPGSGDQALPARPLDPEAERQQQLSQARERDLAERERALVERERLVENERPASVRTRAESAPGYVIRGGARSGVWPWPVPLISTNPTGPRSRAGQAEEKSVSPCAPTGAGPVGASRSAPPQGRASSPQVGGPPSGTGRPGGR